ncbi:MAG TPA: hypothetical protein VF265_07975 [Nevskiaceae bacterium]
MDLKRGALFDPDGTGPGRFIRRDPQPAWLWCRSCQRGYRYGEYRLSPCGELRRCPYADCDGSVVDDGWDWEALRSRHPGYPAAPEPGVVYPLYDD